MERAGALDFHHGLDWYRVLSRHAVDPADEIRFHTLEDSRSREVLAVLPLCRPGGRATSRGARTVTSLSTFYSSLYAPIVSHEYDQATVLTRLVAGVCASSPTLDAIRLSPLALEEPHFEILVRGLRAQGMMVQPYFCFGNWYLEVGDQPYDRYLAARPSALRNTLTRKAKKLLASGRAKLRIVTGGDELAEAVAAYQHIYARSWKVPEPWPEFIPGLIAACAATRRLRLGLVHVDGEPAAAQVWIVNGPTASIYKLAYDEKFADLSVGSVLTAHLMQHVIDVDKVATVDYLTGDDPYKRDWMSHRRERWGILALNRRTIKGMTGIARHVGGRVAKTLLMRARGRARSILRHIGGESWTS